MRPLVSSLPEGRADPYPPQVEAWSERSRRCSAYGTLSPTPARPRHVRMSNELEMKRARPRGFKQVGSRVSADSAIASIEAETMQGARIELTPKVDPDTFIYKNKILLPYELDTVILRARARNSTSLVFVHCMDPRQDKRAISFVKMLTPKRQASRKILSRREGSAVKLQAALRGSISRSKFKELHTLREESMKQMRATFPSRVWAAAKTKVRLHSSYPSGHCLT